MTDGLKKKFTKRISIFLTVMLLLCALPFNSFAYEAGAALPSYFDSRELGIVPQVRDQGSSESCWAFSVIAAMEIDAVMQGLAPVDEVDFSEAHLVWFTYTPSDDENDPLCGESYISTASPFMTRGNWQRAAGTLARMSGTVNEAEFPFDGSAEGLETMGGYDEECRYVSDGILLDETAVLPTEADVKEWIIAHGSCTAMMYYSTKYENAETASYYYFGSSANKNHMVTVVGWDDAYPASAFKSDPEQDGAWIIRDSRGEGSHDGGYFYLSYADTALSSFTGCAVRPACDFAGVHTYNGAGFAPCFVHSNGVSVANVFTAEKTEALTAVSLYTVDENTQADIAVYLIDDPDCADPTAGEQICSMTAVFPYGGYHTVDLPSDFALTPGTAFAVAVTYSAPGGTVTVPVEYCNTTANDCSYVNENGQSRCYLFDVSDGWCDSQELGLGNFYINAYTSELSPAGTLQQLLLMLRELIEFIKMAGEIVSGVVI